MTNEASIRNNCRFVRATGAEPRRCHLSCNCDDYMKQTKCVRSWHLAIILHDEARIMYEKDQF